MLNYFSSIALQEKVINALVRFPQSLTANEREFRKLRKDTIYLHLHMLIILENWDFTCISNTLKSHE